MMAEHQPDHHRDYLIRQLQICRDDQGRLALLRQALADLHASDPEFALSLADEAGRIASSLHDLAAVADALYWRALACVALRRGGEALPILGEAVELFESQGRLAEASAAALNLGRLHDSGGDLRRALEWHSLALDLALRGENTEACASALEALGDLYCTLGDYLTSLDYHFRCLALQRELGNPAGIGVALSTIGRVYGLTGDFDAAFDHYSKSLEQFRLAGRQDQEVKAWANLGGVLFSRGDLDKALEHYMVALAIYDRPGEGSDMITLLICVGNIYERRGDLEAARESYYRAWDAAEDATDANLQSSILLNLANICRRIGDYVRARLVLEHALGIAQSIDEPCIQYQIHESLALVYEQLEYPAQALEHHKRFAQLRHDLAGQEKQKEIAKLQVQFDVASAQREREIFRLRAEKLEADMQVKQNELVAQALHLVQKNQLLDTLKAQVQELSGEGRGEKEEVVDDIVDLIDASRGAEQDWKNFEEQMSMVYPDFVRVLAERFPTLTATELRVCCLLKLNRTTKEMANIMFSSVRTIEVHRYNIRKKLGLDGKGGLGPFLAGI
jgi:tetratricopeptide (TPR) repeat protein